MQNFKILIQIVFLLSAFLLMKNLLGMNNDNEKIKFKEFYTTSFSGIIDKTYKTRYAEYLSLENDVTTYKFSSYESTKCKGDFSDSANNGEMVFKESESFLITLVNQDGTSCKYQIKKRF